MRSALGVNVRTCRVDGRSKVFDEWLRIATKPTSSAPTLALPAMYAVLHYLTGTWSAGFAQHVSKPLWRGHSMSSDSGQ
jgi:hypothetical protein